MSKFENKAEELKGKAKEGLGKATDNERLEAEGKADQTKANVKEGVEKAGDKAKEASDRVLGSFQDDDKRR
ncbi:CsbD family protein [Corynebacterium hylobatis]|uniref:CsbD family protein n=1 Tax=Corynebacterium hylobatis TaxID=1859290 RepID=A0A430HYV1_9CORY|nr:CsbD family protein [Corynebacterium hylobatis]RSZ63745.1 CsbD family protein [Corynebacterium hylobatis]